MRKFGLIGENVTYSYSKIIHEFLASLYAKQIQYDLISCANLAEFDFSKYEGLNVTTPYKEQVLDYTLTQDSVVSKIKSCNTIDCNKKAYNTDVLGFKTAISLLVGDISQIKSVVILGNSKSSEMIRLVFNHAKITVVSRTPVPPMVSYSELANISADLLINTTPVTMQNKNVSPISTNLIKNYKYVYDLNYNPAINQLLADAQSNNIKHENGLDMLIMQAIYAFEIWHNLKVDQEKIRRVQEYVKAIVYPKTAVIGMPFSGKTTYGITQQNKGKVVIDLDQYISEKFMSPEQIIQKKGLDYFREIETKALKSVIEMEYDILILGGGIIERDENYQLLTEHRILWKKCDLEMLNENRKKS